MTPVSRLKLSCARRGGTASRQSVRRPGRRSRSAEEGLRPLQRNDLLPMSRSRRSMRPSTARSGPRRNPGDKDLLDLGADDPTVLVSA